VPGGFGLERVRVRGLRSALDVSIAPGMLCALVGEANAGKSNLLLCDSRVARHGGWVVAGRGRLGGGGERALMTRPPGAPSDECGGAPGGVPSGELRTAEVLAPAVDRRLAPPLERLARAIDEQLGGAIGSSAAAPAVSFVGALESCSAAGVRGLVLLIEEPELYLRRRRRAASTGCCGASPTPSTR
jgi:hypothetical protein